MKFTDFFWVFLGSGLGGCTRFSISLLGRQLGWSGFPISTLATNFLACGLASWVLSRLGVFQSGTIPWNLVLLVGFCGGFSTFSTFGMETWELLMAGKWVLALIYIALSLILGLLAIWLFYKP